MGQKLSSIQKQTALVIKGARENNLKSIDLSLPHDSFVAITGLSGSGKSSLAFDTIYAEGQRRYIETFTPYTRQFFDKVKKPEVESIENVRPAIAIQQRTRITNSRSTVGTISDLNDYIKVLWGNLSSPSCPTCGLDLVSHTPKSLAAWLEASISLGRLLNFSVTAPMQISASDKEKLIAAGYSRYIQPTSGDVLDLEQLSPKKSGHSVLVIIERFTQRSFTKSRAQQAIEAAYSISDGQCSIVANTGRRNLATVSNHPNNTNFPRSRLELLTFANFFRCSESELKLPQPKSAIFSFNHPLGACPDCKGFGKTLVVDPALCVPDQTLSISENALQCWAGPAAKGEVRKLVAFCKEYEIDTKVPWNELSAKDKDLIFNHKSKAYRGVLHWFKHIERKSYKMHVRVFLSRYRTQTNCRACGGTRFRPTSLSYKVRGLNISEAMNLPLAKLLIWVNELRQSLPQEKLRALKHTLSALSARLTYLCNLGLPYLSLDRQARTLSGGETQRVNLAAALGSELVSTHFVLDEPSVGLHMRDTERLIQAIKQLRSNGNSLLVVEHDLDCLNSADHVVELGPEAGTRGGEVVFSGKVSDWSSKFPLPSCEVTEKLKAPKRFLRIRNARARNLKNLSLDIPLERLVCFSGVSGSGKSTLVSEVIKRAYDIKTLGLEQGAKDAKVTGFEHLEQLLLIDQSPLSKSPRSNIATYTGIWDEVRLLLSNTEQARIRALSKSAFSFNVDGGRCPSCNGAGFIREDMQFLSDVYMPCELCLGRRFQDSVLEVTYNGLNADQILKLSVDEAHNVFSEHESISASAKNLSLLGLGHLSLGHSLSELSGGEAQRLKLVPFITEAEKKQSLLIFDEPTTGLHWEDVRRLLALLRFLVNRGHSVICIEHNPIMLLGADWIVDLGPEGGDAGGELIFAGHPNDFLNEPLNERAHTSKALRQFTGDAKSPRRQKSASNKAPARPESLSILGAREHNLKNISVELPYDKIVALTGVSGSGKSTLAKDIIYSEGQRRYLDCLSPYARNFIHELKKPDVDSVSNVRPTVCVYQHTFQPSRLSTVGTMSEAYNFLRLLYSKVGNQYCPDHPAEKIQALTSESMTEIVCALKAEQIRILAPIVKSKKGNHKQIFEQALRSEVISVRVDGQFGKPSAFQEGLERNKPHTIEYVVAQFNPKKIESALVKLSIEQALSLGAGTIIVVKDRDQQELVLSRERACPVCKRGFFRPDPEDLSFVSKRGACQSCSGTGLNKKGTLCASCDGQRLNSGARNLRLSMDSSAGLNIYELSRLDSKAMRTFLLKLPFSKKEKLITESIYKELLNRLDILISFGLDYLEHSRGCGALSGGELQRLRLATAIGSPLSGAFYIFDEPSAGLHPLDNLRVISKFKELRDKGSAVMIIEHDPQTISACEYILDMGPGGGRTGGEVVYAGPISEFVSRSNSETAKALRNESEIQPRGFADKLSKERLRIEKGNKNYLRNFSIDLPLHSVLTIAGVSGSGKSSLLHGLIYDTIATSKESLRRWQSDTATISSTIDITRMLVVDQQPIGRTSRSTPASYLGVWDEIRKLFANSLEAKSKGYTASYFSYNTGKGRCAECKGLGEIRLEMSFMAEASILCEACKGRRFSDDADSIKYLGLSVSEALELTFEEACSKFANHRRIHRALHQACELGLGYLRLGQPSSSLSGGESQRLKLVSELCTPREGHTLYLLDEPTTGLHKADVLRLMKVLKDLVAAGSTVFIIEHDADVVKNSDYIVELGDGPGESGGKIIFEGSPYELAKQNTPWGELLAGQRSRLSPAVSVG